MMMIRAISCSNYYVVVWVVSSLLLASGASAAAAAVATSAAAGTSATTIAMTSASSSSSVCPPRRTSAPYTSKASTHNNNVHGCGTTVVLEQPQSAGPTFGVRTPPPSLSVRGGEVIEVKTLEETQEILSKAEEKLVVIDFTASWCGPCKVIAPFYKELSDLDDMKRWGVIFLKVDVDENEDTAKVYNVNAMPTFLFIRNGEVVDRLMGANAARLKDMIQEYATSS